MAEDDELFDIFRQQFGVSSLKAVDPQGGVINSCRVCLTDKGKFFVKTNNHETDHCELMYRGEMESLIALTNTGQITVPQPLKLVRRREAGYALILSYLDIEPLTLKADKLGGQIAGVHLANKASGEEQERRSGFINGNSSELEHVTNFGFHVTTCSGSLPQDNAWASDWVEFFTQQKLMQQFDILQKKYGDREIAALLPSVLRNIPRLFTGCHVIPSLQHGDLHLFNTGENADGPVIFDSSCFYGHWEYDLAIQRLGVGGDYPKGFYEAYHGLIPKAPGFENRAKLYQMCHCLNHWNHMGPEFRPLVLNFMRDLSSL